MLPKYKAKFWSSVSIAVLDPSNCWPWKGDTIGKYGLFRLAGRSKTAHRVAYEDVIGPIPPGLVIDHLCRNPPCVNPFHLEPVTRQVNALRGIGPRLASERMKARHRASTHCKHGHAWTPENSYIGSEGRKCRACAARRTREWRNRRKKGGSSRESEK